MKHYVIYHANCMDGFGAAYSVWKYFNVTPKWYKGNDWGKDVEYIPHSYGQPVPELEANSIVYIVDYSFSKEVVLEFCDRMAEVIILDHHKTAQENLGELQNSGIENLTIVFDMEKSGAMITWQFLHNVSIPVPELISYIQDRDLWQFKLPCTHEFTAGLSLVPRTFEAWDEISEDYNEVINNGKVILLSNKAIIAEQVKHVYFADGIPTVNTPVLISDTANELLRLYPEAPYAACYYAGSDGRIRGSLRSRANENVDVSAIAKKYGGGGHKNAAGFEVDARTIMINKTTAIGKSM